MAKNFGLDFDKEECANRNNCNYYNNDMKCHNMCEWWRLFDYATYIGNVPLDYKQPNPLTPGPEDRVAFTRLKEIKSDVVNWVKGGNNLLIKSADCGNGKTSWACKIMCNYVVKTMWAKPFETIVVFVPVNDLLFAQKQTFNGVDNDIDSLIEKIRVADLVVWDDMGVTPLSQYDRGILTNLIDNRVRERKTNIFTTNTDDRGLMEENVGARLFSRICKKTEIITFVGRDRRASEWI